MDVCKRTRAAGAACTTVRMPFSAARATHLHTCACTPRPEEAAEAEVLGGPESWAPASRVSPQLLHCPGDSTSRLAAANTEEALNIGWGLCQVLYSDSFKCHHEPMLQPHFKQMEENRVQRSEVAYVCHCAHSRAKGRPQPQTRLFVTVVF